MHEVSAKSFAAFGLETAFRARMPLARLVVCWLVRVGAWEQGSSCPEHGRASRHRPACFRAECIAARRFNVDWISVPLGQRGAQLLEQHAPFARAPQSP